MPRRSRRAAMEEAQRNHLDSHNNTNSNMKMEAEKNEDMSYNALERNINEQGHHSSSFHDYWMEDLMSDEEEDTTTTLSSLPLEKPHAQRTLGQGTTTKIPHGGSLQNSLSSNDWFTDEEGDVFGTAMDNNEATTEPPPPPRPFNSFPLHFQVEEDELMSIVTGDDILLSNKSMDLEDDDDEKEITTEPLRSKTIRFAQDVVFGSTPVRTISLMQSTNDQHHEDDQAGSPGYESNWMDIFGTSDYKFEGGAPPSSNRTVSSTVSSAHLTAEDGSITMFSDYAASSIPDDDDASMVDEEDEEDEEARRIKRGILWAAGGMGAMALVGWAFGKISKALSRENGEDDVDAAVAIFQQEAASQAFREGVTASLTTAATSTTGTAANPALVYEAAHAAMANSTAVAATQQSSSSFFIAAGALPGQGGTGMTAAQ